MDQVFSGEITR